MYNRGERSAFTLVTLLCVVGVGLTGIALVPAPAEAATTVNQCQEINESVVPTDRTVQLGTSLTASGDCFQITTSDVTFDGGGNTIDGDNNDAVVVSNASSPPTNVTVRNLVVTNANSGVLADQSASMTVRNVEVDDAANGIIASGADAVVEDSTVRRSGIKGVNGATMTVRDTLLEDNTLAAIESEDLTATNVTIRNSATQGGDGIVYARDATIRDSRIVGVDGAAIRNRTATVGSLTVENTVIDGQDTTTTGIRVGKDIPVTVRDSVVRNVTGDGVDIDGAVGGSYENVTVTGAGDTGVSLVDAPSSSVEQSAVRNASGAGVFVDGSSNAVIRDNDVFDNNRGGDPLEAGIRVNGSDDARIEANTVQRNAFNGVYVTEADGTLILDNEIVDNCGGNRGLGLVEINDTLVAGNNVSANTGTGISVFGQPGSGQNVTIRDGTVGDNGGSGIESSAGVTVDGIVADENGGNGVSVGDGATVRDVLARDNGVQGVVVGPGSALDNVTVAGNGGDDFYADDGTSTATDLTVGENTMTFASVSITNAALSGLNASTAPAPPSGLVDVGAYVTVSMVPPVLLQQSSPSFAPVVSYNAPPTADESTLTLYRHDGSSWAPVSGATTDANADTVSASDGTGDYALFAEPAGKNETQSPIGGLAGTYDNDADGIITARELGRAVTDYARGTLTAAELGEVVTAFATR